VPRLLIVSAATTVFALALSGIANACSIITDPDVPFSPEHVAVYGEVVGYAAVGGYKCPDESASDYEPCEAWGIAVRILVPLQLPAPGIEQVEYYEFGFGSACEVVPYDRDGVEKRFPVGVRVNLAGHRFEAPSVDERRITLTDLGPTISSISRLPTGADVWKVAAGSFDYLAHLRAENASSVLRPDTTSLAFEIWRDKLRLTHAKSERAALDDLLRISVAGHLGVIAADGEDSPLEKLVARYLRTPRLREEFARRLRAARYDAGVMRKEEMLEVAAERAQKGDVRAMFVYGMLLDNTEGELWIRRAASAGHLAAISEWFDHTKDLEDDDPIRLEATEWYRTGEVSALRAARRRDPTAYLFLVDLYSSRFQFDEDQESPGGLATRRKAEQYSCLLDAHPDGAYWKDFATSAWWYIKCPRIPEAIPE
jgi:hypothetical protein